MNRPHVVALIYDVDHGPRVGYKSTAHLVREEDKFTITIEQKEVRFRLKEHHSTEESALQVVEQYVHRWEFSAGLARGPGAFRLKYREPEIVDLEPTPGVVEIGGISRHAIRAGGEISITYSEYPPPPVEICVSPNVQSMYDRFMKYHDRMEPLPSVAYFCVTVLDQESARLSGKGGKGSEKQTAQTCGISRKVLRKIRDLSTNKGGAAAARKASGLQLELTDQEVRFLKKAIRRIILRAAEVAHSTGTTRDTLTLADLPKVQ